MRANLFAHKYYYCLHIVKWNTWKYYYCLHIVKWNTWKYCSIIPTIQFNIYHLFSYWITNSLLCTQWDDFKYNFKYGNSTLLILFNSIHSFVHSLMFQTLRYKTYNSIFADSKMLLSSANNSIELQSFVSHS